MKMKLLTGFIVGGFSFAAVTFAATDFSDVPADAWYRNAVVSLTNKGIIEGYDDKTYRPGNEVNRAELAVMLDRLITYMEKNQPAQEQPVDESMDDVPLKHDEKYGYYGTFTVEGYLDVKTWECNEGDMCNETVEYASLIIDPAKNPVVQDFLDEYAGNSFVGADSLGLGCYQEANKRIYSSNVSDYGQAENIIQGEDLTKLLESNAENPVTLQLTKPIYTSGMGAPECYSHFRNMEVK